MIKPKEPSKANTFFEALKDNPEEIIEWAEAEIREYRKLIRLIKSKFMTKQPQKPKGYVFTEEGKTCLVRCPECEKENYALNVPSGMCTWCGYDANPKKNDQ
mgnify:CR=1 FL=1